MLYFALVMLSFLAFVGVLSICRGIVMTTSRPVSDREIILIEPIKDSQQNAEFLLRRAARRVMWMGRFAPDRVIALDCNMDSETRRLCRLVCRDYPFMELYSKDELQNRISKDF